MNETSYTRRDVNSILDYLKEQAEKLSEGRWTDFSAGDIGSVLLGLMAYLADVNNFQLDKTAAELYLDTAVERTSIMSLAKLVGYSPRHYQSAYVMLEITNNLYSEDTGEETDLPAVTTEQVIPRYSTFTNSTGTITYTSLDNCQITKGKGYVVAYEGTRVVTTFSYDQITTDGKIYLSEYKVGTNTVQVLIPGISNNFLTQVEDVRFVDGDFAYSVHVDDFANVYIQLPSYWTDLLTQQSTVTVSYLVTQGASGRVGAGIITNVGSNVANFGNYSVTNAMPSIGGYFPESSDELKINIPRQARTMLTIVTKRDLEDLVMLIPDIACIKAGDYNDDWTGYEQPQDAYKCKILVVPTSTKMTSMFDEDGNPTALLSQLQDIVDERRLASLMMYYEDPKRLTPNIQLNIYTDSNDLRSENIASNTKKFMQTIYNRANLKIGQSLYGSTIGRDLLNAFSEITYLEVVSPDINIVAKEDEYIDMYYAKFKIYVNDTLVLNEWE